MEVWESRCNTKEVWLGEKQNTAIVIKVEKKKKENVETFFLFVATLRPMGDCVVSKSKQNRNGNPGQTKVEDN